MTMWNIFRNALFLMLCAVILIACHSPQTLVNKDFESTQLNARNPEDSIVVKMINPYKQVLDNSMQEIVGKIPQTLLKEAPEGTLNNFIADALLSNYFSVNNYDSAISAQCCVLNLGGIRLNELPAGDLTVGKCFELLPFENKLVVIPITGSQIQALLDLVASNKGWPIAGIRMQIQNAKAINVLINGKPLVFDQNYRLLTNDYMANGGDNCSMLSTAPQTILNLTMRDAFIQYCRNKFKLNQPLTAVKDGRIK